VAINVANTSMVATRRILIDILGELIESSFVRIGPIVREPRPAAIASASGAGAVTRAGRCNAHADACRRERSFGTPGRAPRAERCSCTL
ncbi:MAG TPA: hypothetical protein VML75_19950, partial [Kofleriaceae bacterium]|nr:hypothetical protein [Kofleriaceae bacterium]